MVTTCTYRRLPIFGRISEGKMVLSRIGELVQEEWNVAPRLRPGVHLDEFVIMPDHMHALVCLSDTPVHLNRPAPRAGPAAGAIGAIVGQFKSRVSKRAYAAGLGDRVRPLWQRGYHDRIIRSAEGLERARWYIRINPIRFECEASWQRK